MASISCRCGAVVVRFPSCTSPRVTTECCCDHCHARVACLEERGGPVIPSSPARPLLASKWDNLLVVSRGRDKLRAYRMDRKGCGVTNVASSCCHTFLLGRHPAYDARCVTTCDDVGVTFSDVSGWPGASSRWFANQWSHGRISRLDQERGGHLLGLWVDDNGNVTGEEGWEGVFEAQKAAMEREIEVPDDGDFDGRGETFDELIESIGGWDKVEIVGWKQEYEIGDAQSRPSEVKLKNSAES